MRILFAAAALASSFALPTQAAGLSIYRDVAGWTLLGTDSGCSISADYQGGTGIMVSVPDDQQVLVGLSNPAWRSIGEGQDYSLTVDFGEAIGEWTVPARGYFDSRGVPGFVFKTTFYPNADRDTFLADFAVASSVRLSNGRRPIEFLNLAGTRKATSELILCVKQLPQGDPFK